MYSAVDTAPSAVTVEAQGVAVAKGTSTATATANTVTVAGLTPSTPYKAYVVVKDAAGNISDISTIAFTTTAVPDTPTSTTTSITPAPETPKTIKVIEAPAGINNSGKILVEPIGEAFDESVEVRMKDDHDVKNIIKHLLYKVQKKK